MIYIKYFIHTRTYIKYLYSLLRHKYYVLLAGLKMGKISIWRLVWHDASKFLPIEFFPYARHFFGFYPSMESKIWLRHDYPYKGRTKHSVKKDYDRAWNYHQNHNKHHFQYWILINDEDGTYPLEMPDVYVREMIADWLGASRAYTGSYNLATWLNNYMNPYCERMHKRTIDKIYKVLHEIGYVDSGGDGWYATERVLE